MLGRLQEGGWPDGRERQGREGRNEVSWKGSWGEITKWNKKTESIKGVRSKDNTESKVMENIFEWKEGKKIQEINLDVEMEKTGS